MSLYGVRLPQAFRIRARAALAAALGLLAAGCAGDGTTIVQPPEDDERPESGLSFLRQAGEAPALLTTDTTFVATKGEDLEVRLFYAPEPGSGSATGERFLELEIDGESLSRYPPTGHPRAGTLFAEGDTITIRLSVDPGRLIVSLEPTGLLFSVADPAELELRYANADDDYDGDGDDDPDLEDEIDLWRQERPGDPWRRIGQLKDADEDRIRAFLTSFSRYALAI